MFRKKHKKIISVILPMLLGVTLGVFAFGSLVFAQQLQTGIEYGTVTGLGGQDIRVTVMQVIRVALGFLGVLAVGIIAYGGFVWMTAAGNATKIETAKRILVNAVIGLVIIFSAFMISSFIINALQNATGAGPGSGGGECIPGQVSGCLVCDALGNWNFDPNLCIDVQECRVVNITPDSPPSVPMNSVARARFNYPVDSGSINPGDIEVVNLDTGAVVPTNQNVNGNIIELTPQDACPPPNSGLNCFAANTNFEVRVNTSASLTCGSFNLVCGSLGGNCNNAFTTNSSVDLSAPTISIIGTQICQGTSNDLQAIVNDDFGIAYVDFFENGAALPFASDNFVTVPPSEIASVPWNTTAYSIGDTVTIDAIAVDYDSNTTAAVPLDFTIAGATCCNGIKDPDEAGVDCGGSSSCEACVPVIEYIEPLDGAPNNLTTIKGRHFDSGTGVAGSVTFLGDTASSADDAAGINPANLNPVCSGYWTNTQIIIAIPAGTDGPVQVTRDDGELDRTDQAPGTALANFDINSTVRPGICLLNPNSGPISTPVAIQGLNFASPSQVLFGALLAGGSPNISANQITGATVPPLVSNKGVNVRTFDQTSSQYSNPVNFNVNAGTGEEFFECSSLPDSCSPDSSLCAPGFSCSSSCSCAPIVNPDPTLISCDADPDNVDGNGLPVCDPDATLCPEGFVCGSSCFCQTKGTTGNTSAYSWLFTTTSFGPSVVASCDRTSACKVGAISSPTPFNKETSLAQGYLVSGARRSDGAVPVDSIIAADFTEDMLVSSLSPATIRVESCGSASADFNPTSCTPVSTSSWTLNTFNTGFEYIPSGLLAPNTYYRVVLEANSIFSLKGVELVSNNSLGNYSWIFVTRNSSELSTVECVYVEPGEQQSYVYDDEKVWNSSITPRDFTCVEINPGNPSNWAWTTPSETLPPRADIAGLGNTATSTAKRETFSLPVEIAATYDSGIGFVSGSGFLNIDFSSPIIIRTFPNCGSGCLNALIGATFSLPMDTISVRNAMELYSCFDDPSCDINNALIVPGFKASIAEDLNPANTFRGAAPCFDLNSDGTDDYCLLPNTYYRVVVNGVGATAAISENELKPIKNLNFDFSGDGVKDSFSWTFRTQANFGLCQPTRVDVLPSDALEPVGSSVLYSASVFSSPDSCEPQTGQLLDPYSFDWEWSSDTPAVADLLTPLRDVCGNGIIESGEDCDDGNLNDSDSCSNLCLETGDLDVGNNNYNVDVCGNGVVETSEQCELGAPGCAANCVLTGSLAGQSLCGDGQIGIGEQCDSADLFYGQLPQNGDGDNCSSVCLIENAATNFCRSNVTNAFDFQAGTCSSGSCNPGFSCVSLNVAFNGNTNSGPSCGNGVIDSEEECDFGGVCSNDVNIACTAGNTSVCGSPAATCNVVAANGCSLLCVNSGSPLETNDPPNVGPYQIVLALADGVANIFAQVANSSISDFGTITVGNGGNTGFPVVISRFPNCNASCTNVAIGAQFSMSMTPATLSASNISLFDCGNDQVCDLSSATPVGVNVVADTTDTVPPINSNDTARISINPGYNDVDHDQNPITSAIPSLIPNTYYRVVISNGALSSPGLLALGNLNFDDPNLSGLTGNDSYSWIFRTNATIGFCSVDRVEVIPETLELPEGVLYRYYSQPYSSPDVCDPLFGQRLDPYFYDWIWDDIELDIFDVANFEQPFRDGCGNAVVEFGEDCDDGNLADGDLCPSSCLYAAAGDPDTGNSNYGVAVCGNGVVEAGEACDNGSEPNNNDADGCTNVCSAAGAVSGTGAICGDGQVTFSEQCDGGELRSSGVPSSGDGNNCTGANDFAGVNCAGRTQQSCTDPANTRWCYWTGNDCEVRSCLQENSTLTGNSNYDLAVCGNGVLEAGEECDNGTEPNGTTSDGCSNICLNAGSFRADGRIDPYQIIRTTTIGTPLDAVREEIRAWHDLAPNKVGVGELTVVSGGQLEFALIGHQPLVNDPVPQCRNIGIELIFSRPLDTSTINNPSAIDDSIMLCAGSGVTCSRANNIIEEFTYQNFQGQCVNSQCYFPGSDVGAIGSCQSSADCLGSKVVVTGINTPEGYLERLADYQIQVSSSLLADQEGNTLGATCSAAGSECSWSFSTSENFCSCNYVGVAIDNTSSGVNTITDYFTCAGDNCGQNTLDPRDDDAADGIDANGDPTALEVVTPGNQHYYRATCYDTNNPSGRSIPMSPLGHTFDWIELDIQQIIELASTPGSSLAAVTANPRNGTADARVTVTEYICSGSGSICDPTIANVCGSSQTCTARGAATQNIDITNFICNNPWPAPPDFPYLDNEDNNFDPDTNFALYYCRDFGGPSTADDLPGLAPALVLNQTTALKEFIFPVDGAVDALGIKVAANPLSLSPLTWYRTGLCDGEATYDSLCFSNADCDNGQTCQLNIENQGSPQAINIDGYQAIRDGRTVYVAATNLRRDPDNLFSNIYLISYSQNSGAPTQEIFNRILDTAQQQGVWTFNTDFTNHRICDGTGFFGTTDYACTNIGTSNLGVCLNLANKDACQAQESIGCYWDNGSNTCLAYACEPIVCDDNFDCPNLICNANKEKVVRDQKRFGDLRDIQIQLDRSLQSTGRYPTLGAGTYIASTTFSVWPSWQQTFAPILGGRLNTDPINRFAGCPGYYCDQNGNDAQDSGEPICNAAVDTITCPGRPCLPVDTDQATTCWDEVNLNFACPVDAYVYAYRSAENGLGYQLFTRFEYEQEGNWRTQEFPDLYVLPLLNTENSCEFLNLEVSDATIGGGTTSSVCSVVGCYNSAGGLITQTTDCGSCPVGTAFCSGDADSDSVCDLGGTDNCSPPQGDCSPGNNFTFPNCKNTSQQDSDNDGLGNICDSNCRDIDNDGWCEGIDNCEFVANPNQLDIDGDGIGNSCDLCSDVDGDGYGNPGNVSCLLGPSPDCSDNNPNTYPGAQELCSDGVDNDCDGKIDGADSQCVVITYYLDRDGDGQVGNSSNNCVSGAPNCPPTGSQSTIGLDCNDNPLDSIASQMFVGNTEVCGNGIDEDCSGADLACGPSCTDGDGDTYNIEGGACGQIDCNDSIAAINPGAAEICGDGVDNDCFAGDAVCPAVCTDNDGDGYGNPGSTACSAGSATDCNDSNNAIRPGVPDNTCDGIDNNCSGTADEGYSPTATSCGIGICASTGQNVCLGGSIVNNCTPGTPQGEICGDGIDQDCNGADLVCPTERCNIAGDEDGNGLADCADPICRGQINPTGGVCCSAAADCPASAGACGQAACSANVCSYSANQNACAACTDCTQTVPGQFNCTTVPNGPDNIGNTCSLPQACISGSCTTPVEICNNGVDDDFDSLTDCRDPNCIGQTNSSGAICCQGVADCNAASPGVCAVSLCQANNTCSFTPSNAICGAALPGACGTCNPTTFACQVNSAVSCGACGACTQTSVTDFFCQPNQNSCGNICSTCIGSGTNYNCTTVTNGQDCDGTNQCCDPGETCNATGSCVTCTDADRDGICDSQDECPYDPNNDFDADGFCAVGCDSGANRVGTRFNGFTCDNPVDANSDGVPDNLVYDRCQGGFRHTDNDGDGIPNDCETNSCLALFAADQFMNIYYNGRMISGNLYLPAGYKTAGEIIGNGANTYPNIPTKIYFNPSAWEGFEASGGPNVISYEAVDTDVGWRRGIIGAFANLTENGFCSALAINPKHTINGTSGNPAICYTQDPANPSAPQANWKSPTATLSGFVASVPGTSLENGAASLQNLLTYPSVFRSVWSKSYNSPYPAYSNAYCRSNPF